MEIFTYFLSSVLALLATAGIFVDQIARNVIRSQFDKVEQLQVRVDNVPTYQLIQGKVERVRIAGRGLWLTKEARIAALELETDPLNVNINRLRGAARRSPTAALRQPLQAGLRLVLTPEDINQALQSPRGIALLEKLLTPVVGNFVNQSSQQRYEVVNPRVTFLENNRLRFQVELRQQGGTPTGQTGSDRVPISIETGLGLVGGRQFQLIAPAISIGDSEIPSLFLGPLVDNLSKQFDLAQLETSGITARLLQLKIDPKQMEIAAFVRVVPSTEPQMDKK
jgi:LmeA-like phospholipid-binding